MKTNFIIQYTIDIENILSTLKTQAKIRNINYGKQFKFGVKHLWTEINLFYGKRGFSVVVTNKSGSNDELGEIANNIICEMLYGEKETEEGN